MTLRRRGFMARINGGLRGTAHVRVIGPQGEMLGVLTLAEALRAAMREGLDLVEVNPMADPPVCKILDFSRYTYASAKETAGKGHDDDEGPEYE